MNTGQYEIGVGNTTQWSIDRCSTKLRCSYFYVCCSYLQLRAIKCLSILSVFWSITSLIAASWQVCFSSCGSTQLEWVNQLPVGHRRLLVSISLINRKSLEGFLDKKLLNPRERFIVIRGFPSSCRPRPTRAASSLICAHGLGGYGCFCSMYT